MYFVIGDGNQIGRRLKGFLYASDWIGARNYSESITSAISTLKLRVDSWQDADVIFSGGDEILFTISDENMNSNSIYELGTFFEMETGSPMSFGIGKSLDQALINLDRAKTLGLPLVMSEGHE